MLILVSPAKNVNEARAAGHATTKPRFVDEAQEIVSVAQGWSQDQISDIMKVSANIAKLNVERFASWTKDGDCAAGLLFDGDVYRELDYGTLDEAEKIAASKHLRILSGLYGLLRPTDAVRAYRMEMGRKIPGHEKGTLYKFWDTKIAEAILKDAGAIETDMVLNLASVEYSKAVDKAALGGLQFISPRFEEEKAGTRRVIGTAAKRARGAMARWVLQHGVTTRKDLEGFNTGGYAFDPESSDEMQPVFVRTQVLAAKPAA